MFNRCPYGSVYSARLTRMQCRIYIPAMIIASGKLLMQKLDKICNYGGLKPFIWLGNIFGIFSGTLVKNRLKPSGAISRCYVFVVFGIRTYFGIAGAMAALSTAKSSVVPILAGVRCLTQFTALTLDAFTVAFFEKRFVKFFEKLAVYDERVAELGHQRRDRYARYWIFIVISIAFAILTSWADAQETDAQSTAGKWTEFAMKTMYMLLQSLTLLLSIFKFDLLVHLMYQRFRHFNKSIISSVSWTRELTPKNMNYVSSDDALHLHSTLLDASRTISETYSFFLLFWFANLFVSTVMQIYVATIQPKSMIAYYVSNFIISVVTCAVCSTTAEEANNADKKMANDHRTRVDGSISMDKVRMQLYFLHNRVVFSAADFFVINLPLFYSMIVVIATYGVLLTKSKPQS